MPFRRPVQYLFDILHATRGLSQRRIRPTCCRNGAGDVERLRKIFVLGFCQESVRLGLGVHKGALHDIADPDNVGTLVSDAEVQVHPGRNALDGLDETDDNRRSAYSSTCHGAWV